MIIIGVLLVIIGLIAALVVDIDIPGVSVTGLGLLVACVGAGVLAWAGSRRLRRRPLPSTVSYSGPPESGLLPAHREAPPALAPSGSFRARLGALPRLLRSDAYGGLGTRTKALWVLSLVYFVSPIDVIPDLLPIVGVTDDLGLLIWLVKSVFQESGRYLSWERNSSHMDVR